MNVLLAVVEVALFTTSGADVGTTIAKVYGPPETVVCFAEWEALPDLVCWKRSGKQVGPVMVLESYKTKVVPKETGI